MANNDVRIELELDHSTGSYAAYRQVQSGAFDRRVLHGTLYARRSVIAERVGEAGPPKELAITFHFPPTTHRGGWRRA